MQELIYTKETTYQFDYNGDINYDYHFVDNILNMRFRSAVEDINNSLPSPLNIKGTSEPHQIIQAVLVGERVYFEDDQGQKLAELLYLLPDINYYLQVEYRKEYDSYFKEWLLTWGTKLASNLIKKQEENN